MLFKLKTINAHSCTFALRGLEVVVPTELVNRAIKATGYNKPTDTIFNADICIDIGNTYPYLQREADQLMVVVGIGWFLEQK